MMLEEHLGPEGRSLAKGWDGDRYALVQGEDGTEGLIWVSVWDSESERDRFVSGFQPALTMLGAPAELNPMEVVGRPGAVLHVRVSADVQIEVTEVSGH